MSPGNPPPKAGPKVAKEESAAPRRVNAASAVALPQVGPPVPAALPPVRVVAKAEETVAANVPLGVVLSLTRNAKPVNAVMLLPWPPCHHLLHRKSLPVLILPPLKPSVFLLPYSPGSATWVMKTPPRFNPRRLRSF